MNIVPVRAFRDNYIWLMAQEGHAVIVDPGDARPVLEYLGRNALQLSAILVTHHHDDHIGGIPTLLRERSVPVYAPRNEGFDFPHQPVSEGDLIQLPQLGMEFLVLDVPGHTNGHVAYYGGNSLFCGDTLFGCGCGRVFEGTPEQLFHSLLHLSALPDATRVYPAHEYTLGNIRFARMLDPHNLELEARQRSEQSKIDRGEPTLPSTLLLEKSTNPFLRCHTEAMRQAAQDRQSATTITPESVFAAIRELKNLY